MSAGTREPNAALLHVIDLTKQYALGRRVVSAISHVSFVIERGESLGIVGESGAGKSTLARCLAQIQRPTTGAVLLRGRDLTRLRGRVLLECRRDMQLVFQDPSASLDPKWRVSAIVEEPLIGYNIGTRRQRQSRAAEVLDLVELPLALYGNRRPGELSGGECQRVAIARALAIAPALLVCDEPVSSLDVVVAVQVLDLLERLRATLGLALLFISHDLDLIRRMCDRVAVLHAGQICEIGPTESVYAEPLHPYTRALLAARNWSQQIGTEQGRASVGPTERPANGARGSYEHDVDGISRAAPKPDVQRVGLGESL